MSPVGSRYERQVLAAAVKRTCGLESQIAGTSMAPAIPDGARIRISPEPQGGYRTGMVVACLSAGNRLFAHRIVRCMRRGGEDYVVTLGDGWQLCDPPTAARDVVGSVNAYRVDQAWLAPEAAPPRSAWSAALSRTSVRLVLAALYLHPEVARRTAGTLLNVGSWLKSLHGMVRR